MQNQQEQNNQLLEFLNSSDRFTISMSNTAFNLHQYLIAINNQPKNYFFVCIEQQLLALKKCYGQKFRQEILWEIIENINSVDLYPLIDKTNKELNNKNIIQITYQNLVNEDDYDKEQRDVYSHFVYSISKENLNNWDQIFWKFEPVYNVSPIEEEILYRIYSHPNSHDQISLFDNKQKKYLSVENIYAKDSRFFDSYYVHASQKDSENYWRVLLKDEQQEQQQCQRSVQLELVQSKSFNNAQLIMQAHNYYKPQIKNEQDAYLNNIDICKDNNQRKKTILDQKDQNRVYISVDKTQHCNQTWIINKI